MYKLGEKDKKIVENMKRDKEFESFMNEITHAPYLNRMNGSTISRVPLQSEYSPSSSFSNGFCSSEDGSPYSAPFEETKYQSPNTHCLNGLWFDSKSSDSHIRRNVNEKLVDELGLCENLRRMHFRYEQNGTTKMRGIEMDPDGLGLGFEFGDCSLGGSIPRNVEKSALFEGFNNNVSDCEGFRFSPLGVYASNDYKLSPMAMGSYMGDNQSNASSVNLGWYKSQSNYLLEQRKEQGRSFSPRGIQLQNPSTAKPYLNDGLGYSPWCGMDNSGVRSVTSPLNSPQSMQPKPVLSVDNPIYGCSMLKERRRAFTKSRVPQSVMPMKGSGDVEAFSCEDSLIIQGKSLNYVVNKAHDSSKSQKKNSRNDIATRNQGEKISDLSNRALIGVCENHQMVPHLFCSLAEVQGSIYLMAKDQNGCRSLQRIFDVGTSHDVQLIFEEIIDHVVELMKNPFGNYLIQKLLDVCTEEQRLKIVLKVTNEPEQLVKISLNMHGTRVVQKLIETLKTRWQISLVKTALEPGFLHLIKDLNGNHVVQRCLQHLSNEDNTFVFEAAAKFCVEIATHRHGCCVLQQCITHSNGEHRNKLIAEISRNGLLLAQDPFGNYVVQYIIELNIPSANADLLSLFEGNFLNLSMQKCSSHVVEKCLRCCDESRSRVVRELLSVSHFEQLLQDPYANYVIQAALEVTKGPLHASLVNAVRPHTILRTSPYCKRIFSNNLLRK